MKNILVLLILICPLNIIAQNNNVLTKKDGWRNFNFPTPFSFNQDSQFQETIKQFSLENLCEAFSSREANPDETDAYANPYYLYEAMLYNAAGIQITDSREAVQKKMYVFWDKYGDKIGCKVNSSSFPISFMKAVIELDYTNEYTNDFLKLAVDLKLPLNQASYNDYGRTLLDYVADKYHMYESDKKLAQIYEMLRNAGAKHRFELEKDHLLPTAEELFEKFSPEYYEEAAKGNAAAMHSIATFYMSGIYVKKDNVEAKNWLKKASEAAIKNKDFDRLIYIAFTFENYLNDNKSAFLNYKIAADNGNGEGMLHTAKNLYAGVGTNRNTEEALKYFKLASQNSVLYAFAYVGRILVEKGDKAEGAKWLRYTAQQVDPYQPIGDNYTVRSFCTKYNISECGMNIKGFDACKK